MLDAALQIAAADGFRAVTMEGVARRAAIAKTVVYNAFPTRDVLLTALLQREGERALAALTAALADADRGDDPLDGPLRWVEAIAVAVQRDPVTWRLILFPPDEPPPALRAAVQAGRDVVLQQVRDLIDELARARPAIARYDRDFLPLALLAVCEEGARQLAASPDEYDPARVVAFARDLLAALSR